MCFYRRCHALPKKTFEVIKKTGNDAILQVKGNQPTLEANCLQIVTNLKAADLFETEEIAHGRFEYRKTETYNFSNRKSKKTLSVEWEKYIQTLVVVTRERHIYDTKTKMNKISTETSLYLASFTDSAKVFHHAIRNHWGIENRNHYVRDETMGEDKSRIRKNPQNFAKLRSIALNLMRKKQVENVRNELCRNAFHINKTLKKYSLFL